MVPPRNNAHALPLILISSGVLMAGLAVAFWMRAIDVGDSAPVLTAVVGLVAVSDVGIGLYFFSRRRP